jgi:glutamyl-tRNA synthetase
LRIEDTDQKRYVPEAEQELIHSLRWLGLSWDEGPDIGGPNAPYRQSERKHIYRQHAEQLISLDKAYYCFCSPERLAEMRKGQQARKEPLIYDGTCRRLSAGEAHRRVQAGEAHVVRFKTPREGSITVHDLLRGAISVENRVLDDFILLKSDGLAVYHLAAMVDDHLMGITHVIRGSEWLSTFPLHGHIIRAFGWTEPVFVHLSVFLKPSGKGKMSKRESAQLMQDGHSVFLTDLEQLGYIPEGVVNWIALMGWSYDDRTEYFLLDDLINKFSLHKLNPSPAAINFTKLDYFNGLHIRALAPDALAERVRPIFEAGGYTVDDKKLHLIAPLIQPRITTLEDALDMAGFFFKEEVQPLSNELIGKKMTVMESAQAARRAYDVLASLGEINAKTAEQPLRDLADELGLSHGQLFGILRVAVTGQSVSPPLFESMAVIGKQIVLQRIQNAIAILDTMDAG